MNKSYKKKHNKKYKYSFEEDTGAGGKIAGALKACLLPLYLFLALFFCECVCRVYLFGSLLGDGFLYILLFTLVYALIGGVIASLFRSVLKKTVGFIILLAPVIWMLFQTVYYTIFSAFFTLYSVNGAEAVTEYTESVILGIIHSGIPIILCAAVLVLYFVLYPFMRRDFGFSRKYCLIGLIAAVLCYGGAVAAISAGSDEDVLGADYLYHSTFIPQLSVEKFGLLTTFRLDLRNMVFGTRDTATAEAFEEEEAKTKEEAAKAAIKYDDNVMQIDFKGLSESGNDTLKDMDAYFSSVTPTAQNEYTGMFKGKNLIWICAEGFSTWAMDKELTPTLWKLSHESFVFENYYNPVWGVSTSDGEYTVCTGLLPKTGVWSMSKSAGNYMPFCMGNQMKALNYLSNAYHNHSYTYYDRDRSHPNMGYNFIAKGHGMEGVTTQWPESDVEMMESTVKDFASQEPFCVYYMTVSGHLEYNFGGNAMSKKHQQEVANLPYSDHVKAYIACQIELDRALDSLIKQLEAAGTLEDTLIVLSGDHYPYGLTYGEIDEVNGSEVEKEFELYRSTLIMWNSVLAQEEPVIVDKPCYSVDILPTLSNLFGLDYDSRLLMGRDIFSTASPLVVFSDHSWLTDKGRYNAKTQEFIPEEGAQITENYAKNMMDKVNTLFTYSARILETDYYKHLFLK